MPDRRVPVTRAQAFAVAAIVKGNEKLGKPSPEWMYKVVDLVIPRDEPELKVFEPVLISSKDRSVIKKVAPEYEIAAIDEAGAVHLFGKSTGGTIKLLGGHKSGIEVTAKKRAADEAMIAETKTRFAPSKTPAKGYIIK